MMPGEASVQSARHCDRRRGTSSTQQQHVVRWSIQCGGFVPG
jgi:hypothetical protein